MSRLPLPRRLLAYVYGLVRRVTPSDEQQILFHSYPDIEDNALALFAEALKEPTLSKYNFVWLANDVTAAAAKLARIFGEFPARTVVYEKNSVRGVLSFLRSATVFSTHGTFWFARSAMRQRIVNLWHGMPLKRIGLSDDKTPETVQFCTHAIATSPFFAGAMAAAFGLDIRNVAVTGLPRNDWLQVPQDWRQHVGARDDHRLCVWMPTFRQSVVGEMRSDGGDALDLPLLEMLDSGLDDAETFLLIKLHPMDALNSRVWPQFRNIKVMSHEAWMSAHLNVYRVLADADRLVTDFSSVAVDYCLLRRPIALYVPDLDAYTRGFTPGALERFQAAMTSIATPNDLLAFLREKGGEPAPEAALAELNSPGTETAGRNVLRTFVSSAPAAAM